jgi:hypothetical protein
LVRGKNIAFLKRWKSVSRVSEENVVKFLLKIQDFGNAIYNCLHPA